MFEIGRYHISKENSLRGLALFGAVVLLCLTLKALFALSSQEKLPDSSGQTTLILNKPEIQHEALFGAFDGKNGPLQESGLSAELKGVFATQDPEQGSAVISVSGRKSQLLTVGDTVAGSAVIKEIYSDYVVLEEAGQRSVLRLPKKTF
jgi:type II secretory pathway component PulC